MASSMVKNVQQVLGSIKSDFDGVSHVPASACVSACACQCARLYKKSMHSEIMNISHISCVNGLQHAFEVVIVN